MLSVICLDEIHHWGGCMHLMVYHWRPRQIAVVRILQSQSHKVNGLNASGDLTMKPLLSTSEDLGMKTVLLAANCRGTRPPASICRYTLNNNVDTTLQHTCKGCMEVHQGREQIPFLWPWVHRSHSCHFPTKNRQVPSERIREWSHGNGAARLQHVPQRFCTNLRIASCQNHPHPSRGDSLRQ